MTTVLVALRAALYGGIFMAVWIWLELGARRFDGSLGGALPAWLAWIGWPLVCAGSALAVACVAVFVVRGRGTAAPFDPPQQFVALGPYCHVRNPMYVGAWILFTGLGLVWRSPSMLAFVAVPVVSAVLFVQLVEEPGLERRFGAGYLAYKAAVPRWFPRRARGGRQAREDSR